MKCPQLVIVALVLILAFACKEKTSVESVAFEPDVNFNIANPDFKKWWSYHYYTISLSSDFTGINEQSDTITKRQFLDELISGTHIPLKLKSPHGEEVYKLFKLDPSADESIGSTVKDESLIALKHFNMEGQAFPPFTFMDLNDSLYTSENTKGKIVVFKTWFIGCTACVAEFPELNELVEKNKNRTDMVFVSLATDAKPELEKFLSKKVFEYEVVPGQKEFILNTLSLDAYPTHIVVDKNGTIRKVVNKASEMIAFLENESSLMDMNSLPPPPPPM
jgi:peroxiredoxin